MVRLHILAEGETEETFVRDVLRPHLADFRVWVDVRCLCAKKRRTRRTSGGVLPYGLAKADLERWMREDPNEDSWFSTMFDLYGLPRDFPGFTDGTGSADPIRRVGGIEKAFSDDIANRRFLPYIQLHEFEALLLSDPLQFDWEFIEHDDSIDRLVQMVGTFETPEHVDDDPESAPSKRIIKELPEYEGRKASAGSEVAQRIGLATIRSKCGHFDGWLSTLESLPGS